jgi:arginyl-tRNA synthetase
MLLKVTEQEINKALNSLSIKSAPFQVFFVEHASYGHVTSNVAMILAKDKKENPKILAENILAKLDKNIFKDISVAGAGFINFTFTNQYLANYISNNSIKSIKENLTNINQDIKNKKVLIEYTDANPFKIFHIGHLMANIIGESIAGMYEAVGAKVKRINYQGDVGRHIAINIYAILKNINEFENIKTENDLKKKVTWLGQKYASGFAEFDNSTEGDDTYKAVTEINNKIYERSDNKINEIYDAGREWSLEYFEELYKMLGTRFDKYIFESECAPIGIKIVKANMGQNKVFEIGEGGAIIYDGEKVNLHKRVFVNKNGLPTYEAKDLGNMQKKMDYYPDTVESIVITANEQNDYFKVLYSAIQEISKNVNKDNKKEEEKKDYELNINNIKLKHYGHGMMRFADGKMSSRKGNIISGQELIDHVKENVASKFTDSRIEDVEEKLKTIESVAIGAIKYTVLRQAIGRDVVFDMSKAISVDGDSGPYIQYTYARLMSAINQSNQSVIEKNTEYVKGNNDFEVGENNIDLVLTIAKYEDIITEALSELAAHKIMTYLIDLCHEANSWYTHNKIANDINNQNTAKSVIEILSHALSIIKIHTPNKM